MAATSERSAARSPAADVAYRLRDELAMQGIAADVHDGYGVALISVWIDLVVWVECGLDGVWRYIWWTGRIHPKTGRWVYTGCPFAGVSSVARQVGERYRELLERHPWSPVIAEVLSEVNFGVGP
ncbi:hypothetical protein [Nonomuraea sp. NPDC049141]|uniref:hypothetical protein n=1 Tax=Nonomuraea sp. NPDC049141 TaxID=3155500 RepID=UPI0033EE3AB2